MAPQPVWLELAADRGASGAAHIVLAAVGEGDDFDDYTEFLYASNLTIFGSRV